MMTERNLLLVDDEVNILKALQRLLRRDGYTIFSAQGGAEALQLLKEHKVGVIVSDHRMPVMTGTEFLAKVKLLYPDAMRIVLSGFSDIDTITDSINQGNIYKFIAKPWDDMQIRTTIQEAFEYFELRQENSRLTEELKTANAQLVQKNLETSGVLEQVVNHNTDGIVVVDNSKKVIFSNPSALTLLIEHYRVLPGDEFKLPFKENQIFRQILPRTGKDNLILDIRSSMILHEGESAFLITLHDVSDVERAHNARQRAEANIKKACLQMAQVIALIVEKRERYIAAGHQKRVADLAVAIGDAMELSDFVLEGLRIGALVYDIGKIYIPLAVLKRAGSISKEERLQIQGHVRTGYDIISTIDFPWPIADMVLQHHEHVDGSGYPNGLCGDAMCLESKILALADVVVAMLEDRPYRTAYSSDEVLDYMARESGKRFAPEVVESCIKLLNKGALL